MLKKSIEFGGHTFIPQKDGSLYWPDQNLLIVSDLHFEKSSHFAKKGIFLPPYDTLDTLQKLQQRCDVLKPETVLFLGDVFHDYDGVHRIMGQAQLIFNEIIKTHSILWIDGNHDRGSTPEGIVTLESIMIQNISFTHIATQMDQHEISGHYHPCRALTHKGHRVRRPCFVYNDTKLIMPAYGVLTGGLNCDSEIIQRTIPSSFFYMI